MSEKTKILKIIFLTVFGGAGVLISLALLVYYFLPDFDFASSRYGRVEITVDGKQLYFKREARGLNYDKVILSPDQNVCAEYKPEKDIGFKSLDDIIYYRIDSNTLYLLYGNPVTFGSEYQPDRHIARPKNFPVRTEIIEPTKLIVTERKKTLYNDLDLKLLEIPFDDSLKCRFN